MPHSPILSALSPAICKLRIFSSQLHCVFSLELTELQHSALKTLDLPAMGKRAPSQVAAKRHSLQPNNPKKVTSKYHHIQQRSPSACVKILSSRYSCGLTMSGHGHIQYGITVTKLAGSGHSLPPLLVRGKISASMNRYLLWGLTIRFQLNWSWKEACGRPQHNKKK